jgi:CRISPR system Cascade subunit CasB
MTEPTIHPFIARLQALADGEDRGALASLRRGLGQPPATVAPMYRYVEPFLAEKRSRTLEAAHYLIASLFALHPQPGGAGNLGSHMAKTRSDKTRSEAGDDALERRFTALLSAHVEDLPDYLRHAISFLKSKEVPVNWNQLFRDLQDWDKDDRRVQKRWAAAFWGHTPTGEESAK